MNPNIPEFFSERMKSTLREEYESFKDSLTQSPPASIRLNPYKPTNLFADEEKVPWFEEGRYLDERPYFTLDPHFHAGAYYVQEASSMFIGEAVKQLFPGKPDITALDLCAAPGGKATLLNSVMSQDSLLVANEVISSRVKILEENIVKWGAPNCEVTNNDPRDFKKLKSYFDLVLIDAPCSGEGMFRKGEQAAEAWSEETVEYCSKRQNRILSDATHLVKAGGYLVYSTCTFAPEENEHNMQKLLDSGQFEPVKIRLNKNWDIVQNVESYKGQDLYTYHFFPHRIRGEGLFVCCLRKKAENGEQPSAKKAKQQPVKGALRTYLEQWLAQPGQFEFFETDGEVTAVLKAHVEAYHLLTSTLRVRLFGIHMGTLINDELKPSHELALSTAVSGELPFVEVSQNEAIQYLKSHPISADVDQKGWVLVRYNGLYLGWIKVLDKRVNNYYPKEYRIRRG